MPKAKTAYVCQSCGTAHVRWQGRCEGCGDWNSVMEELVESGVGAGPKMATAGGHPVALVPLVVWFVISLLRFAPENQAAARAWLASPVTMTMLILAIAVGFWHATLGVQVVIEDYVHAKGWRIALDLAVKFIAAALTVASVVALFKIAFGG